MHVQNYNAEILKFWRRYNESCLGNLSDFEHSMTCVTFFKGAIDELAAPVAGRDHVRAGPEVHAKHWNIGSHWLGWDVRRFKCWSDLSYQCLAEWQSWGDPQDSFGFREDNADGARFVLHRPHRRHSRGEREGRRRRHHGQHGAREAEGHHHSGMLNYSHEFF